MANIEDWQKAASKEVKGKDLTWQTPEGIAVKPLYTAEDVREDPGLPGFAPFTRGVRASMYANPKVTEDDANFMIARLRTLQAALMATSGIGEPPAATLSAPPD